MPHPRIVRDTAREDISPEILAARIMALSPDDQKSLGEMTGIIVETLGRGVGAVVLMADVDAEGRATMIAAGNAQLVPHLLRAANSVADQLFTPDGATVQ